MPVSSFLNKVKDFWNFKDLVVEVLAALELFRHSCGDVPSNMEKNDSHNKPPAELIERVKAHLRNVHANLEPGGPSVDWEELQLFIEGVLGPDDAENVRHRVEKWRSWYNARLQLLVAMCNSEDINGGVVE